MQSITIRYFAILKEQRGQKVEVIETDAATPEEIYKEQSVRHNLSLPLSSLRVAVNDEFSSMTHRLQDGDVIAFIAPVAGG